MDPSRITATIRPRSAWESIDLGFALARTWFLPLWLCWWVAAAPLALATLLPLHRRPELWLLPLWWCKPAFEALPLYWLSRALFGERLPVATAARRLPQALPPRLWPQLLWRRIGVSRAFSMPVTLLEAPKGAARRARLRVLGTSAAGWLTIICAHLETVLWLSASLLLAFLLPEGIPRLDLAALAVDSASMADWIGSLLILGALSVMAPFYVAAGFALYLGRRTHLEAWDLELAFRRGRARREQTRRGHGRRGAPAAAAVLLVALALVVPLPPAQALTPEERLTPEEAHTAIDAVLAEPDFGGTRQEWTWVYVGNLADASDDDSGDGPALPDWLIQAVAVTVKWLLLLAAATALALLALRLLRDLRARAHRRREPPPQQPVQQPAQAQARRGGTHTALPLDIPGAVRERLAAGDSRGALALLYRAQIAQLRDAGLDLPDSATEEECLAAAGRRARPEQAAWLTRLVRLWQGVAYGHRRPDPAALESLLADRATLMQGRRGDA
ncbi:MAG: DUF4129 domain-containing protein [Thiohalocapsa sp.]|jgi:hypothetical protein|uniref:DUF4129 domain-containing protein n=1 Tax=Thiohalocapsa sp. TaxID=2497641 RepID=UPI0025D95BBF|nr:DUF4129 domain-containing protein [Thiohalocapsa sp.]MCG6942268.1 DUF4129 domain-containing protein [Thiohalocapsa sp.]